MEGGLKTADDNDSKNATIEVSQSHALIGRVKREELRTTQSSPDRKLELHHTRSFSEIRHLHPSSTDVSFGATCPKAKAIVALQEQVKRPESVLEISDLSVEDGEEEVEEDIVEAQEKGDEAMKKFLEMNISIPLDSAMTSSSGSLESLDSDLASEHELIMATWESEARESIASYGSAMDKRFLTPSGQLLYREQQVDSLLDTKRLKLSPSSVERPMSPLAVRSTENSMNAKQSEYELGNKRDGIAGRGESDDNDEQQGSSISLGKEKEHSREEFNDETEMHDTTECDCGHYSRVQDMQRLLNEYEVHYDELVNKRKQQGEEMKTLRKDNVNMHKEHNRLQLIIKECYKQEETLEAKITKIVGKKDKIIGELNMNLKNLNDEMMKKDDEIAVLKKTIETCEVEISKYGEIFIEIGHESNALIEALAKELGAEKCESLDFNLEGNGEVILSALKKRRCSLRDDFKSFSEHVFNPASTITKDTANEVEQFSQATDASINELQNHMHENFHEMTTGCEKALSHVQQTRKGVDNIQQYALSLQTTLLETKPKQENNEKLLQGAHCDKADLERQLTEIIRRKKYDEIMRENSKINEDEWMNESERKTKENSKLKKQMELNENGTASMCGKSNGLYQEKGHTNSQLQALKGDVKKTVGLISKIPSLDNITNTGMRERFRLREAASMRDKTKNNILPGQVRDKLWKEIQGIYQEHFDSAEHHIAKQQLENQYFKQQLVIKEREEEINKCYIKSLETRNEISQKDLQMCKAKSKELKKELRQVKDRLLILGAQKRISSYFNEKNGNSDISFSLRDCLRVEQHPERAKGNHAGKDDGRRDF